MPFREDYWTQHYRKRLAEAEDERALRRLRAANRRKDKIQLGLTVLFCAAAIAGVVSVLYRT